MVVRIAVERVGSMQRTRVRQATHIRGTPNRRSARSETFLLKTRSTPTAATTHTAVPNGTVSQSDPCLREIRPHLLSRLDAQEQQPSSEYPIGVYADEVVVWQLGEFREVRAIAGLRRIANFEPSAEELGPFGRTRQELVKIAREAIAKIEGGPA